MRPAFLSVLCLAVLLISGANANAASVKRAPEPPPAKAAPRAEVTHEMLPPPPLPAPPMPEIRRSEGYQALFLSARGLYHPQAAARWVETQDCWFWLGLRPSSEVNVRAEPLGECVNGRATGNAKLKLDFETTPGQRQTAGEIAGPWFQGVPLADTLPNAFQDALALPDRAILFRQETPKEEGDLYAVSMAGDDGRAHPCEAKRLIVQLATEDNAIDDLKEAARRAGRRFIGACPSRLETPLALIFANPDARFAWRADTGQQNARVVLLPVLVEAEVQMGRLNSFAFFMQTAAPVLSSRRVLPGSGLEQSIPSFWNWAWPWAAGGAGFLTLLMIWFVRRQKRSAVL